MNKVKTNLFALAAGVLISPVVMAGDINSESFKTAYANEALGLAAAGDVVEGGNLVLILGAEFTANDVITLTFSGDALDASTLPTTIETTDIVCESGVCSTVTLGQLNADSASAQYRVTEIDSGAGNTTVGLEIDFGVLEFDPAAVLSAGSVTVAYSAETNNGLALDSGSGPVIAECMGIDCNARSTDLLQTGQYFGINNSDGVPTFNGIVDVNTQRTTLTNGPDDDGGFEATLNSFDDANDSVVVQFDSHNPIFEGDFSWITDPDTAEADGVVDVAGGCSAIVVTATEVSAECLGAFATLTLDPSAQDPLTTLSATTYTASTDVLYSDTYFANAADGMLATGSFGVGAWTLNGFQADVAYMPFQSGISQIIYFANRSTQDGEISVDWIDADQSSGSFTIGQSLAGSTRAIGPAINAGLPAAQQEGGRLALTITVNVPACQGQLNSQYNVSGDRAFSVSTTNCPVQVDFGPE